MLGQGNCMSTYNVARKMSRRYRIAVLSFTCLLSSCGGGGGIVSPPPPTPVFSLQLGQENPLLTSAQRSSFGLQYGRPTAPSASSCLPGPTCSSPPREAPRTVLALHSLREP